MYCCGLICKFYIQPRKSNTMSQKRVPTDSTIKSGWSQTTLLITSTRISSSTYLNILNLPAGGHSLIRPIRVCAAEQGMVFKVLSLKQGIQFHYYCVRGTRMQPLSCVECSVHYWVSCAINKGGFFEIAFSAFSSSAHICLALRRLLKFCLWRANSCGDFCFLGVHLSKVCWGLIFCLRKAFIL